MEPSSARISRRTLLGGVLAAAVAGCGRPFGTAKVSVAALTADDPFYIAHRGGGGNWPEMTAYAYAQAAQVAEIKALEISVCLSADGVLVCSHDPTTTRLTGAAYTIAEQTWGTLSTLMVTGAETSDPKQQPQPLTRFDEVVDAYHDRYVLFVEPKVPPATEPLMKRMVGLNQPERVVWKAPINSSTFAEAKRQGFATWGYVLNEPAHLGANLDRLAASADIDMLGAPRAEPDPFITAISSAAERNGKLTIAWPILNVAERDRVRALGCRGMMTSRPLDVLQVPR